MLRALGCLGLAGLAFAATAALVRSAVPLPGEFEIAGRVAAAAAEDGPALLVLGPSTTRCGFDPRVFDAELARRGHPLRSANLAVPGARNYEIDHLLERVIEARPPGLRYVAIEYQPGDPARLVRRANRFSDKEVYWHTPRQVWNVLRALSLSHEPTTLHVAAVGLHLRHGLWRATSLGQGDRLVGAILDPAAPARDERRGYEPEDCRTGPNAAEARARYLADPAAIRMREQRLDRQNARPVSTRHLDPARVRAQVARLRAAGVEPVYFLTPILSPVPGIHSLHREGVLPTLLAFDSPRRHPALYRPEHRLDDLHLNPEGAERFSRLFAGAFAAWLDGRPVR